LRKKDKSFEPKINMAKTSKIVRERKKLLTVRHRNRCQLCGRSRGYLRQFGLCRLCFKKLADKGEIPGVRKASW